MSFWQLAIVLMAMPIIGFGIAIALVEVLAIIGEWRRRRNRIIVFGGER